MESPEVLTDLLPDHSSAAGLASGTLAHDHRRARIAIIDDQPLNVRVIRHQLVQLGYTELLGISDSTAAVAALEPFAPDVVLLDVVMPHVSGTELLARLRRHPQFCDLPVIVLTASQNRLARLNMLELGVSDFLAKPADQPELATRLRNVLQAKQYRDQLSQSAQRLEQAVRQRTRELEASRRDVVLCLARAAEFRDDNTGRHVMRVGRYSALLAEELGLPSIFVEMIELAAQLHDVGKIGIPDSILHKPVSLSPEETAVMRRHTEHGHRIVAPSLGRGAAADGVPRLDSSSTATSPMLAMASRIALSHHEHWDGSGYPQGLAGNEIPLEARIAAVADVFDALSTPRCYKPAYPLEQCFEIIECQRAKQFDPDVVHALVAARDRMERTYVEFADESAA